MTWEPMAPDVARALHARRQHAARVREDRRLALLFAEWDALTEEQKWDEWCIETDSEGMETSRFAEVPGFAPVRAEDGTYRFIDFRNDQDGLAA